MPGTAHYLASRFGEDRRLQAQVLEDQSLQAALQPARIRDRRARTRSLLLAQGVQVTSGVMPGLAALIAHLADAVGLAAPVEAYVVPDDEINAATSRGADRVFLLIHAGTLDALDEDELVYLLGHELGHVLHGHIDVMQRELMDDETLGPRLRLRLHAWSRAAEISADRVGLLACGAPEAAVRATFRIASGVRRADGVYGFDAAGYAAQWDRYAGEVRTQGSDHFEGFLTHPLPHLRMKALLAFWDAGLADGSPEDPDWRSACTALDAQVAEWLTLLDPLTREGGADPFLAEFLLWGGLGVALADGALSPAEAARIAELVPEDLLAQAEGVDAAGALARFGQALAQRRDKLTSPEIFRIVDALAQIAWADRALNAQEREAMEAIADHLGVTPELILERHRPKELQ